MNSNLRQGEVRCPTRRVDIMPSLMRIIGWFSIFIGFILFFIFQGRLDLTSSVAAGVVLLSMLAIMMFTGNQKLVVPPPKTIDKETNNEKTVVPIIQSDMEEDLEIVSSEPDEKLERSRKKKSQTPIPIPPPILTTTASPVDLPEPPVMPIMPPPTLGAVEPADGTILAKKLVISSDAQSEMESEIEDYVDQRRSRQAEIRSSLERKRRMALAERRAAKARLWTEVEDGEDLTTLLKDPNHGLTIIEESEEYDDSRPLGVSYVRIDNTRILKLTVPLVVESKATVNDDTKSESLLIDNDLPLPPGLPPMPPPPGLPPMPPPPGLPPMPPQPVEKE